MVGFGVSRNTAFVIFFYFIFVYYLWQQKLVNFQLFLFALSVPIIVYIWPKLRDLSELLAGNQRTYSLPDFVTEVPKIKEYLLNVHGIVPVSYDSLIGEDTYGAPASTPHILAYVFSYFDGNAKKKVMVRQSVALRESKGLGIIGAWKNFNPVETKHKTRSGALKFPKAERQQQQILQMQPIPLIVKTKSEEKKEENDELNNENDSGGEKVES